MLATSAIMARSAPGLWILLCRVAVRRPCAAGAAARAVGPSALLSPATYLPICAAFRSAFAAPSAALHDLPQLICLARTRARGPFLVSAGAACQDVLRRAGGPRPPAARPRRGRWPPGAQDRPCARVAPAPRRAPPGSTLYRADPFARPCRRGTAITTTGKDG